MAIYHFSAKVIGRASGSSAVASAAYRSASRLDDERLGRAHDFSNKAGVVHSEVLLPEGAPERLGDRATLWNSVETGEVRKDAQLAREVEFAIPREMTPELHYGQDDFADRDSLVRTLSRERSKDMASDHARDFADRLGIERDPAAERQIAARAAFERHAQAVSAIFKSWEGAPELPALRHDLNKARRALDAFGPDYSRDVERAYKADPPLAHDAAGGRVQRAIQAMRLEAELRMDAPARAERFASKWKDLDAQRGDAYRQGDMMGMKRIRDSMGAMAKGLERDPQLESILAARKQQLGIGFEISGDLKRELAASIGFDMGRGRGIGI